MMSYEQFENLEAVAASAAAEVGSPRVNYLLQATLNATAIRNEPLKDVTQTAQKWREREVPQELFINHGSYIGDGLEHIKKELKQKPSSNRALYSLINQAQVSGTQDRPIPSFMVFQCAVLNGELYCTAYFRALEVARFFRINLEEIRLNICEILEVVHVSEVNLTVFAFNVYNLPNQIPLERCRLDLMSAIALQDRFDERPSDLAKMLDEKARETTIIEVGGLHALAEWLAPERRGKWPVGLNAQEAYFAVQEALDAADRLRRLRQANSRSPNISAASAEYVQAIAKIAKVFRK